MGKVWLRKLIHQLFQRSSADGRPSRVSAKRRPPYLLSFEHLENRTLLSTVQPVTAANLQLPLSDSAGGTSQVMTSADGRFTVYASTAPNVVPGQVNTAVDSNIFLYDQQTGTTTLVSHAAGAATTGANGDSEIPRVSGDGSFVAFESIATNLVPGQNGPAGQFNVFLYDNRPGATQGTITLVSHRAGSATTTGDDVSLTTYTTGFGFNSNSGQFLLFNSAANDLLVGQTGPTHENVFLYNTATGTTTLVSHNTASPLTRGNGDSEFADLTPDGNSIVFESFATDLVAGQSGTLDNIFLYNSGTGNVQLVSGVFTGTGNSSTQAAGFAGDPYISADGSTIAYASNATDLVSGQTTSNGSTRNVFSYNTGLSTTSLASGANGSASVTANADSRVAALSSDGSTIAFTSDATNLTPGQGGTTGNVFVYNTSSGALTLASHASNSTTTAAGGVYNNVSFTFADLSVSSDGRFVAYISTAKLAAGQSGASGTKNVYVYDGQSGQNTLVSQVNGSPNKPGDYDSNFSRISDDGSTVAFLSLANNLDPAFNIADGGQNLFLFDVTTGAGPTLGSRSAFQASATSLVYGSSGDGRFVLFSSNATNVVPHQTDYNFDQDLFLYDRSTGTTTLVSHIQGQPTTTGNFGSPATVGFVDLFASPVISNDGNFVAFVSQASNLLTGETANTKNDQVYLFDRLTDTVTLISHSYGLATTTGNDVADSPAISADGTYVVFRSLASDLIQGGVSLPAGIHNPNIFMFDTVTGTMTLVSHYYNNSSQSGDSGSAYPVISDDGTFVAYPSRATDLVAGATVYPTENDFVYDRLTGTNALVSHVVGNTLLSPDPTTAPGTPPTVESTDPVISADGSTIAYASFATNLVAGQTGIVDTTDVFLYNVATGTNLLASGVSGSATATANNYSDSPVLNANGSEVVFRSTATNLVAGQVNPAGSTSNIFLYYVPTSNVGLVSHANGSATTTAAGNSTGAAIDGLGGLVVYLSTATNLVPSQGNPLGVGVNNAFLFLPATNGNVLVSGQNGSPSLASATPVFLAIISRDPVAFFNLLSGAGAASAGFSNSLVQLAISGNTVPDGSAPDTFVGTLSVISSFGGALLPPTYTMPAGEDNNTSFILGSSVGGQANLFTDFTASAAVQPSYLVSIHVNFNIVDLNDLPGTLAVLITSPPSPPPPPPALSFLATAGNGTVVARLPNYGVWRFENTSGWVQLTATTATQVDVDANGDVVAILGGSGVWRWEDARGWIQLSASSPLEVSIAGTGIIAALFAGAGVWRWEDLGGWRQLTASSATQVGVDANGDVVAALLNAGVWRYEDASSWVQLTGSTPTQVGIAGNGYVVVSFQGAGVWRWEDASGWVQLTVSNAASVAIDDQGDLVALLAGAGVWRWEDAAGWQQLTGTNAVQVDIGGNGNVVAELQGAGVWRFENVGGWVQLTATNAG